MNPLFLPAGAKNYFCLKSSQQNTYTPLSESANSSKLPSYPHLLASTALRQQTDHTKQSALKKAAQKYARRVASHGPSVAVAR